MYAHVKPHPINKFLDANKIGIELIYFPSQPSAIANKITNSNKNINR